MKSMLNNHLDTWLKFAASQTLKAAVDAQKA
jgi:hypothetical protein